MPGDLYVCVVNIPITYVYYSPMLDDVNHEETVGSRTEVKNERERTRVRRKGELLNELKQLIKHSCLTDAEDKRKRFTEVDLQCITRV